MFRRTPSRDGHGRQAAVDFVVCYGCGEIYFVFFFFPRFFFFERTRPAASMRPPCFIYLYILLMRRLLPIGKKKPLHTGVRTGCHYLNSLSVCLCVCVTFVVFTDCEICTRPISTNPGSMEAGEYRLTRGMCFVARRLEVVTVAGLLWTSW